MPCKFVPSAVHSGCKILRIWDSANSFVYADQSHPIDSHPNSLLPSTFSGASAARISFRPKNRPVPYSKQRITARIFANPSIQGVQTYQSLYTIHVAQTPTSSLFTYNEQHLLPPSSLLNCQNNLLPLCQIIERQSRRIIHRLALPIHQFLLAGRHTHLRRDLFFQLSNRRREGYIGQRENSLVARDCGCVNG